MKILVFDIDGTLTGTNRVDGHFFLSALQAVLDLPPGAPWDGSTEMTDSSILARLCTRIPGADYRVVEPQVQQHFFTSIEAAASVDPDAFHAIRGAERVFDEVRGAGWAPAIATGGWRRSAEFKLRTAGIPTTGVPIATASEHDRRVDIIRHAVRMVAPEEPSEVVYVGDGSWDVRACRELGIGFIGRADPEGAQALTALGASAVLPDFAEPGALLDLLADPAGVALAPPSAPD